jgi:hypothetical protein
MINDAVSANGDVIIQRVVQIGVDPGVYFNSHGRCYAGIAKSLPQCADACADRLQHEGNTIGTFCIFATQINIEFEVERLPEINLVDVPDGAGGVVFRNGKGKAVAVFLVGAAVMMIGIVALCEGGGRGNGCTPP